MIKVVNPFNKNMEEVYTSANSCECHCSVQNDSYANTKSGAKAHDTHICSCSHGVTNSQYNYAL